jgi:hypothetical protein
MLRFASGTIAKADAAAAGAVGRRRFRRCRVQPAPGWRRNAAARLGIAQRLPGSVGCLSRPKAARPPPARSPDRRGGQSAALPPRALGEPPLRMMPQPTWPGSTLTWYSHLRLLFQQREPHASKSAAGTSPATGSLGCAVAKDEVMPILAAVPNVPQRPEIKRRGCLCRGSCGSG